MRWCVLNLLLFLLRRKISGPHICGNALDIEPSSLNIITGSWRQHTPLEVIRAWFDIFDLLSVAKLKDIMVVNTDDIKIMLFNF